MATQPIRVDLDLNQNELQNAVIQNLASAPASPKEGQIYYNTTSDTYYGYKNGSWVALDAQGLIYSAGTGIDATALGNGTIQVATTIASKTDIGDGQVIYQKNGTAFATISVNQTSTTTVNYTIPTQASDIGALPDTTTIGDGKTIFKKNGTAFATISANQTGTVNVNYTIPTQASDIGALPDTTTIGAANTIIEVDGSAIGTINANATSDSTLSISTTSAISIASSSTDYLTYSDGAIGAKVDGTVTASSTKLITSGAVDTAIANALVGGVKYVGTWTATSQTDYSSITLPVKKGYMYLVEGSATIGGIEWNAGDYLMVNADVASGGTLTNVSKIDNTEASDIVRLNGTQTLTNKTIDADDNTISDLTVSNFKSGVVLTSIRPSSTAVDTTLATELAIAKAIESASKKISSTNPALTASGGVVTWTISNTIGSTDVVVQVFEVSTNTQVMTEVGVTSSTITIKMNSTSNISAGAYRAIIVG